MKLTEDQEQAVSAWYARYCIDNGKEPIKLLASNIAVAATERMQDEIDVWCAKLKAHEKLERDARFENAKLLKVVELTKQYADSFDSQTVGGKTFDFLRSFHLLYGLDQGEDAKT